MFRLLLSRLTKKDFVIKIIIMSIILCSSAVTTVSKHIRINVSDFWSIFTSAYGSSFIFLFITVLILTEELSGNDNKMNSIIALRYESKRRYVLFKAYKSIVYSVFITVFAMICIIIAILMLNIKFTMSTDFYFNRVKEIYESGCEGIKISADGIWKSSYLLVHPFIAVFVISIKYCITLFMIFYTSEIITLRTGNKRKGFLAALFLGLLIFSAGGEGSVFQVMNEQREMQDVFLRYFTVTYHIVFTTKNVDNLKALFLDWAASISYLSFLSYILHRALTFKIKDADLN